MTIVTGTGNYKCSDGLHKAGNQHPNFQVPGHFGPEPLRPMTNSAHKHFGPRKLTKSNALIRTPYNAYPSKGQDSFEMWDSVTWC